MTKEIWINLPVKDLTRSREFFTKIGFNVHPHNENNPSMAGMSIGEKKVMIMLVLEETFKTFIRAEIADASQGSEVILSFDAESREEVDEIARKAEAAGGTLFGKPEEIQGWMYGCGFIDPDGHRWNALYMDFSKLPK
ncbi:VOC family protein [Adhaeribacter terreus]|uniref:VOC family protein n=1 Tax=Adhaeribacter terreus TaxID=529703 RepID=A0ABW0EBH1_9BACT